LIPVFVASKLILCVYNNDFKDTSMKKIILLCVAFVACCTLTNAQSKGNVEFGFNGGLNTSFIADSQWSSDYRTGFNAGASADFYFSKDWSLKVKAIYDRKGWNNDVIEGDRGILYKTNYNLDYITVPVMANFHFGYTRNWYVNFGPYVGFLLNAEDTRFKTDVKSDFNTTDFGLAAGLGVKIPVSNYAKIYLEYDLQSGFTDIFKENINYGNSTVNFRNSFNVGINFML